MEVMEVMSNLDEALPANTIVNKSNMQDPNTLHRFSKENFKSNVKGPAMRPLKSINSQKEFTSHLLILLRVCIVSYRFIGKRRQYLVRPLLGLNRHDTNKLCTNWDLPVYPDSTNEKLQFLRNRLRKQLLPLLRLCFNPRFDNSLFQCSELFLQEQLRTETLLSKLERERDNDNSNYPLAKDNSFFLLEQNLPIRLKYIKIIFFGKGIDKPSRNLKPQEYSAEKQKLLRSLMHRKFKGIKKPPIPKRLIKFPLENLCNQNVKRWHCLFLPQIGTYMLFR